MPTTGRIWVQSEPGAGATLHRGRSRGDHRVCVMTPLTQERTIVVVEDNAADAGLVGEALEDAPSAPVLLMATIGREAPARLRAPAARPLPGLVLLDLNLPGARDGVDPGHLTFEITVTAAVTTSRSRARSPRASRARLPPRARRLRRRFGSFHYSSTCRFTT